MHYRVSDGKLYEDVSEAEQDAIDNDDALGAYRCETVRFPRPSVIDAKKSGAPDRKRRCEFLLKSRSAEPFSPGDRQSYASNSAVSLLRNNSYAA